MTAVTADLTVTLDGFAAGPQQRLERPFGDLDDERLHAWMFDHAEENAAEVAGVTEASAYVMGRNMFGPGRGAWDLDWRGWWGEDPPYHAPVFVLTHHPREPLVMTGGTTFTFVTSGPDEALARAREAAGSGSVAIAGGAATVNTYLTAGAIDELRLHVVPFTAGAGSRVFDEVPALDVPIVSVRHTPHVTHLVCRPSRER